MASPFESIFDREPPPAARVLRAAHQLLFTYGYQAFTMDQLAHELGMSKKTLYVHFRSKDAIIDKIIATFGETLHQRFEAVLADPNLAFTLKLAGIVEVAGGMLTKVTPTMLRDLQRFAPPIYQKIEDIRGTVIPKIFGELIREGIKEGRVRRDIDPEFATEFWLHAIRGLVQPAALERSQLTLPETFNQGLDLFFAGLLTPAGRKDYEKHA